jgi:hypothetical protein
VNHQTIARSVLMAAAMLGSATASALAGTDYTLLTTIGIPTSGVNVQPGGAFTAFDISYFDPSTGLDYVADRSNAAVDILSGSTNSFVGRAIGGFTGQQASTSVSGPDGVVVVASSQTLFAGNGDSTLRSFNVSTPSAPTPALPPGNTGGSFRTDEMAYSPTANLILVANNADAPAFATLVNATTGAIVAGHITIPGTDVNSGLEQSVWDPSTGTFFVSVPAFAGSSDPGGIAEIDTSGNVLRTIHLATFGIGACSPAGLVLGGSGNLMIGCSTSGSQTVLLNPAGAGSIVKTFGQISGSDELWYDSTLSDYFVTGVDGGTRAFDVISDTTDLVLQTVPLPDVNAHSIAVDPLNGEAFVPLEGTTPAGADLLCPSGCIAVFAQSNETIPEPGSLPLFLTALLGVMGVSVWRNAPRS